MCLIISEPRKIDFIYKLLFNFDDCLYSPFFNHPYIVGDNYPKISFEYEINNELKVRNRSVDDNTWDNNISIGVLHAFTNQWQFPKYVFFHEKDINVLIVRLPIIKEDIVAFGSNNDIALKKIHIPQELYSRIITSCIPNYMQYIKDADRLIPVYW